MTLQPLETISESLSSSHIATISDDDEPEVYTIIKISGKGMGMVANTDIPPGKLIIEEKPLLSVPLTASGDLPGRYDTTTGEFVSTVLIQSLSKLTDKELEEFYYLSDSVKDHQKSKNFVNKYMPHMAQVYAKQSAPSSKANLAKPSNTESPFVQTLVQKLFSRNRHRSSSPSQSQTKSKQQSQQKVLSTPCEKPNCDNKAQKVQQPHVNQVTSRKTNYGIMKTNSFTIEITVSKIVISPAQKRKIIKVTENRLALFPKISRLNHSCQPNCNHYWCGQAGKFMIRAIRPISKGEELSISYMSPLRRRGFTTRECRRKILYQEFGFLCHCEICDVDPAQQDITDDDNVRERVSEIEQFWSTSHEESTSNNQSPYLTAFILSSEQLVLCQRLRFHAGLVSYVVLHNIEAASGLLQEIYCDEHDELSEFEQSILNCMKSWCMKIRFPDKINGRADDLSETSSQISLIIQETLHHWLTKITKLALYYGSIAYGSSSAEYNIFKNIDDVWNENYFVDDQKKRSPTDYQEKYKMTCQNISLLC